MDRQHTKCCICDTWGQTKITHMLGYELRNSLRKLNLALAIAVPYYGILFLEVLGQLDHIGKFKKEMNHALVTFDSHSALLHNYYYYYCIFFGRKVGSCYVRVFRLLWATVVSFVRSSLGSKIRNQILINNGNTISTEWIPIRSLIMWAIDTRTWKFLKRWNVAISFTSLQDTKIP